METCIFHRAGSFFIGTNRAIDSGNMSSFFASPPPSKPAPVTFGRLARASPGLILLAFILVLSQFVTNHSAGSQYRECSKLAQSDPQKALKQAHIWRQKDPESPIAGHCEAIALYAMKDYSHAAIMLDALAQNAAALNSPLAADLALQTAVAFEANQQNDKALTILSSTLTHGGSGVGTDDKVLLLSERAHVYRLMNNPLKAVQDMDYALTLEPDNAKVKALLIETAQQNKVPFVVLPEK